MSGALPSGLPRAVLLDLDGTLVDTGPVHAEAFARALADGAPALLAGFRYEDVAGLPTGEALGRLGVAAELRGALALVKQAHYRSMVGGGQVQAFPGADALLRFLAAQRIPFMVVTSGSRGSAAATLTSSGLAPVELVCADDVQRGKPAPDAYLAALARLALPPEGCLAVEDSAAGIAAAQAAGVPVVSVHGDTPPGDVPHFASLEALHAALASLAGGSGSPPR